MLMEILCLAEGSDILTCYWSTLRKCTDFFLTQVVIHRTNGSLRLLQIIIVSVYNHRSKIWDSILFPKIEVEGPVGTNRNFVICKVSILRKWSETKAIVIHWKTNTKTKGSSSRIWTVGVGTYV